MREAVRKAMSTLAATVCGATLGPEALRTKTLARGRTAWMVAAPSAGRAAQATQSPATG